MNSSESKQNTHMKFNYENFCVVLADAIGIDRSSVEPDLDLVENKLLDSLALISLIAVVDLNFNVSVRGRELLLCSSIREVYQLIESKLNLNRQGV